MLDQADDAGRNGTTSTSGVVTPNEMMSNIATSGATVTP
jgi:hypothetical protein